MAAPGEIGGQRDVVAQRQLAERTRDLKGPGEPQAAYPVRREAGNFTPFKLDRSGGRRKGAGDQVEGRRLPRPVRANQPQDLALLNREIDLIDGEKPPKPFGETGDLEQPQYPARRLRPSSSGLARQPKCRVGR